MSVALPRLSNETSMRSQQRRFASTHAMIAAMRPSYPVYCVRPHIARRAARQFLDAFPGRVLYAIKCNPHPLIVRALYDEGVRHFDTASLPEIAQVREMFRDADCYFMHPVKGRAVIRTADQVYAVEHFVVDHIDELRKILAEVRRETVTIFVRIATPAAGAVYNLSAKFGCKPAEAVDILKAADAEGCRLGMAFHVGSQCTQPTAYRTALRMVADVLAAAKVELDYLDVGGGYPARYLGQEVPPLDEFITEIATEVAALKLRRDCVLMCEPGRALVADAISLVTQVHLRKGDQIYINDGVYGSFNEVLTAQLRPPARMIRLDGPVADELIDFTVYGPTCDSYDVLPITFRLPADLREGDWIEFDRMGAYSNALVTKFNGFHCDAYVHVEDEQFDSL